MAVTVPGTLQALQVAFKKHFQDGLKEASSDYLKIATVIPTATEVSTYGWLGSWPGFREWVGDREFKNMAASDYQIVTKSWESSVAIDKFKLEDDVIGIYTPIFKEQGLAAGRAPDQLTFNVLRGAHEASAVCYDGKPFFDDKHPVYPGVDGTGTVTNATNSYKGATGAVEIAPWYLIDDTRSLKPLIFQEREKFKITNLTREDDESVFMRHEYRFGIYARHNVGFGYWQLAARSTELLNAANFNKVFTGMRKLKGNGGIPLDIRPRLLLVPPQLYGKAMDVVGLARLANGADNPNYNRVQIVESAWLD